MQKKRSIGVTIFGLSEIVFGILVSYMFWWYLIIGLEDWDSFARTISIVISFRYLILCISLITLGLGLLSLKSWARKLNLIFLPLWLFYIEIASSMWMFGAGLHDSSMSMGPAILEVLRREFASFPRYLMDFYTVIRLAGIIIVFLSPFILFLTRPKVKEQFQ